MSNTPRVLTPVWVFLLFGAVRAFPQDTPKVDLFLGYSFLRANQAQNIPAFTNNGGVGTLGININDHIGFEAEFGGYHNGNVNNYQFDTTSVSFLFGPRFSYGRSKRFDPYIHTLFGGMHTSTSISKDSVLVVNPLAEPTSGNRYAASQANFAMAIGGGIDIKLGKVVVFRPIQLDYFLTRFEAPDVTNPTGTTKNRNQNDLRYAAGFMFNFGGERPEPPPPPPISTKVCPDGSSIPTTDACPMKSFGLGLHAAQTEICQGSVVPIAPSINVPEGASYQWTVNEQPSSQAPHFEFGTTGREPGTYKVGLRLSSPGYHDESTETTVTVLAYTPPAGSIQASPPELWAGDPSTLSSNFRPTTCGGPIHSVSYVVSEGSVSGTQYDSSGVQFDAVQTSEQRKTVTVTATATDDKGSGSAATQIVVKKKAALMAKRFPDIVFPSGKARVNNCGKRVLLEELKSSSDQDPGGKVVLVGHVSDKESQSAGLDQKRALNAAAVISSGQGVCSNFPASQVLVSVAGSADNGVELQPYFCGTSAVAETPEIAGQIVRETDAEAKYRRVEVWFVPSGGMPPGSVKDNQVATNLGVSGLGCPK